MLRNLLDEGMRVVFSCVKGPCFDQTWIGREINEQVVKELKEMHELHSVDIGA